ncbi:putative uncharacterized protein DDB_G0289981 [Dreissena polymorpha]|uniref:putative uncharacterized protein DDB_G0289981 n=1 Tax=Dreissena polymorpha TaxID=45954 RepID=UPI00226520EB|nr:putative uncharacterized protein DDB_G0289981 [Dreissena polymorpha]
MLAMSRINRNNNYTIDNPNNNANKYSVNNNEIHNTTHYPYSIYNETNNNKTNNTYTNNYEIYFADIFHNYCSKNNNATVGHFSKFCNITNNTIYLYDYC